MDNLDLESIQNLIVSLGVQDKIVETLCSLALSDHLGDVRDSEGKLWDLIGAPQLENRDWDASPFQQTRARLVAAGIPLPDYLGDDEDDD